MTVLVVRVDPSLAASTADQIVSQIAAAIAASSLAPGASLPTIRRLAADLGLAPGTVARAYAELERDGWVVTQGRRGTAVALSPPKRSDADVTPAALALAVAVRASGLSVADAHRALDIAIARIEQVDARTA